MFLQFFKIYIYDIIFIFNNRYIKTDIKGKKEKKKKKKKKIIFIIKKK